MSLRSRFNVLPTAVLHPNEVKDLHEKGDGGGDHVNPYLDDEPFGDEWPSYDIIIVAQYHSSGVVNFYFMCFP